jgi:hypothetical protein
MKHLSELEETLPKRSEYVKRYFDLFTVVLDIETETI